MFNTIEVYVLLSDTQTLFCFCILTFIFWLILESKQYDFGNKVTKRSRLVTSQRYIEKCKPGPQDLGLCD